MFDMLRQQKARHLLRTSELPVAEVSALCGYASLMHLDCLQRRTASAPFNGDGKLLCP